MGYNPVKVAKDNKTDDGPNRIQNQLSWDEAMVTKHIEEERMKREAKTPCEKFLIEGNLA